jgi:hypothetical protein
MKIRHVILGFAVALNLMLVSLALPVHLSASSPAHGSLQLVPDGIPLPPPPPPPPKNS